jgi:hypothetical protein
LKKKIKKNTLLNHKKKQITAKKKKKALFCFKNNGSLSWLLGLELKLSISLFSFAV